MAIALINCERDDICAETTSTTPRLIVEFYDIDNPTELKNVPRLTVYGEGLITDDEGNIIEPVEASDKIVLLSDDTDDASYIFNANTDIMKLPLKIDDGLDNPQITTRYVLEKDTNLRLDIENPNTSNKDIIEIRYIPNFEYVSRACGYKSVFTQIEIIRDPDTDPWIEEIEIVEPTIENENTTHVRIFH